MGAVCLLFQKINFAQLFSHMSCWLELIYYEDFSYSFIVQWSFKQYSLFNSYFLNREIIHSVYVWWEFKISLHLNQMTRIKFLHLIGQIFYFFVTFGFFLLLRSFFPCNFELNNRKQHLYIIFLIFICTIFNKFDDSYSYWR